MLRTALRWLACAWALLGLQAVSQAGIIKGTISGPDGTGLAFANVAVRGTALNTGSNEQGRYQLKLDAGTYQLIYQYVGYRQRLEVVRVPAADSALTLNVRLEPEAYSLGEVTVRSSDEDPAYNIIRQAQQWRPYHKREVAAWRARIYIKALGRLTDTPGKILGLFKKDPDLKPGIFYLSESLSDLSFQQPDVVRERMIASRISGDAKGISFNRASAGRNLNFYNNVLKSGFSERGFVSPIAANALLFYKYELVGSTPQGGEVVHKIRVVPRRASDPVFSGFIYIVEGSWRIHSVDLGLGSNAQLDYVDNLHISQLFAPAPGQPSVWLIQSQRMTVTFSALGFKGSGYVTAAFSNYAGVLPTYPARPEAKALPAPTLADKEPAAPTARQQRATIRRQRPDLGGLNAQVRKQVRKAERDSLKNDPFASMSRNEVQRVEKGVNKYDSTYWAAARPVPLTNEERRDYQAKDSTEVIRESRPYQDSLDRARNKFEAINLLVGGYTHQNSFRKRSFTVLPVANILQYNTVEGTVLNAQLVYSQRTDDRRFLTLTPTVRYGFSSQTLNPSLGVVWQLHPAKLQQVSLVAGRTIQNFDRNSQLTPAINSLYTLLANYNYAKLYRRDGAELSYLTEPVNGLTVSGSVAYFDRHELANATLNLWRDVPGRAFTSNQPVSAELPATGFGSSRLLAVGAVLEYRPGQRYISRPDGKFNLGSKWPTFNVQGRLAIPHALGAEVRYLLLQGGLRHSQKLGLLGTSNIRFNVGGFVGKQEGMTLLDFRHFSGNQTLLAANFNEPQLLDYYRYATRSNYAEAHYDHHFNGFLLNKFPLIRRLKWQEVASLNYIHTAALGHYLELGLGIEHILKILRVDFYTAIREGNGGGDAGASNGLRIGLGF